MTKEQTRRIIEAIVDCDNYIAKESRRNPSLRPPDVQKLLDWYISHKQKLIDLLAEGNLAG